MSLEKLIICQNLIRVQIDLHAKIVQLLRLEKNQYFHYVPSFKSTRDGNICRYWGKMLAYFVPEGLNAIEKAAVISSIAS